MPRDRPGGGSSFVRTRALSSELVRQLTNVRDMVEVAEEIQGQLDRLTVARPELLPPQPRRALLVDLADRNVLDEALVERALSRVCDHRFLPRCGTRSTESSAGRNLMLFAESSEARRRFASVLVRAGRRQRGTHVSFRQLWSAIAFAITAGKKGNPPSMSNCPKARLALGHTPSITLFVRVDVDFC